MTFLEIIKKHIVGKKIKLYNGNLYSYENYDNDVYFATILDVLEPNSNIENNSYGVVLILQTPYQNDKRLHIDHLNFNIDKYIEVENIS